MTTTTGTRTNTTATVSGQQIELATLGLTARTEVYVETDGVMMFAGYLDQIETPAHWGAELALNNAVREHMEAILAANM